MSTVSYYNVADCPDGCESCAKWAQKTPNGETVKCDKCKTGFHLNANGFCDCEYYEYLFYHSKQQSSSTLI